MAYRVWVAATASGHGLISRATMRNWERMGERIVDSERVYGSQIWHRVVATTPDGPRIMTPTEAQAKGYDYSHFPRR